MVWAIHTQEKDMEKQNTKNSERNFAMILFSNQTKHVFSPKHSLSRESCNHPMFPSSIASGPVNFITAMLGLE
jgi:hypothetical protein